MKEDPTIVRIRAARHQISEQYHHDPQQVIIHYIELEQQHQERFIDPIEEKDNFKKGYANTTKKGERNVYKRPTLSK
jgi:ssDNA-specific exonuclease RecJ